MTTLCPRSPTRILARHTVRAGALARPAAAGGSRFLLLFVVAATWRSIPSPLVFNRSGETGGNDCVITGRLIWKKIINMRGQKNRIHQARVLPRTVPRNLSIIAISQLLRGQNDGIATRFSEISPAAYQGSRGHRECFPSFPWPCWGPMRIGTWLAATS